MNAIKITRKQAAQILSATFPDYTGKKISVKFQEKLTFYDTNWSGGTRNKYAAYRLDIEKSATFDAPAPWMNPTEGVTVQMPTNGIIVEHSHFCGKDCGITIYSHPQNAPKWLTA